MLKNCFWALQNCFFNPRKTVKSDEKVGYLKNVFFDGESDTTGYGYLGPHFGPNLGKKSKNRPPLGGLWEKVKRLWT